MWSPPLNPGTLSRRLGCTRAFTSASTQPQPTSLAHSGWPIQVLSHGKPTVGLPASPSSLALPGPCALYLHCGVDAAWPANAGTISMLITLHDCSGPRGPSRAVPDSNCDAEIYGQAARAGPLRALILLGLY